MNRHACRHNSKKCHHYITVLYGFKEYTVEPDLIATEMLAFPSKSSRNQTDSDLMIAIPYMGKQLLYKAK